jgi:N-acetylglutamate synthase-like GNAT family acetyltransferase
MGFQRVEMTRLPKCVIAELHINDTNGDCVEFDDAEKNYTKVLIGD